jgi:hypothetical protein
MAALRENDPASRRPPLPSWTITRGSIIATDCSRCRSQHDLRIRHGQVSTPEQKCIGSPEQNYSDDAGKDFAYKIARAAPFCKIYEFAMDRV